MADNLDGKTVEIDGKEYILKSVPSSQSQDTQTPPASSPPLHSSAPVESKPDALDTNTTTSNPNPGPPHALLISRTALTHAETGQVQNTITLSAKSDWSLSDKSLVTVAGIGALQFRSLDDHQIHVNPANEKSFVLQQREDDSWTFEGVAGNLKWGNIDDEGTMSLVYHTTSNGTVEVARLTGSKLEFKQAKTAVEGGWESVVLSGVAMKEQKVRGKEEEEAVGKFAKGFLGGIIPGLV